MTNITFFFLQFRITLKIAVTEKLEKNMYRKFGSNRFEPSSQNLKNHRTENRTDSPKSVDRTELNLNRRFGSFGSQFLHQFGTELRHHYTVFKPSCRMALP